MGEHDVSQDLDERQLRDFMKALLADCKALERMLEEGRFETGIRRIGAEQEMFVVDRAGRPARWAMPLLERLNRPEFTTELAQFNLECNLLPQVYGGACLSRMESELRTMLGLARDAAEAEGGAICLSGILPTLSIDDLGLDSMTPNPRYRALNDAMARLRGGAFRFRIKGLDELDATHDNVMLESCNTSFQIHFQVAPDEFARLYNLAQAITGPVLAAAVNSPVLLGKRLWKETRVALFQQSVDARSDSHQLRGLKPRVSFGSDWIENSVLEIFREDIARFRVVLATDTDEDPMAVLDRGEVPQLTSLRLHNGTVYRWNRACYGVADGVAHLRIENRVLPAGPTVLDEMANAAFFFGLMSALADEVEDVRSEMEFDWAQANFLAAARLGLKAHFKWFGGEEYSAAALILVKLLPLARKGLRVAGIDAADIDRYLGVLEERVRRQRTGAQWMLESLSAMERDAAGSSRDERMRALAQGAVERQRRGDPVHTWELARVTETSGWRESYLQVGHFMTTDLFTVRPGDVVDLAASLMDWRHIRHVPVEDDQGMLAGLVSHRAVLRLVGQGLRGKTSEHVVVSDIMKSDPVSVGPRTPTLEAIELMRKHKVGCLPVVEGRRLVGIITERDLIRVAGQLFEQYLRDGAGAVSGAADDGERPSNREPAGGVEGEASA